MSHTTKNKAKTLSRVRRIKGQVEAIERALEGEGECEEILQLVASCRGALNGLMAELIDGHFDSMCSIRSRKPVHLNWRRRMS